ncbi:hypothetical protein D5086_002892 [Populus alba]|uniref:Uncharacterized protein n=1 Tax=Populus alba TaxID=43335 RepID=A0ACC4D310_POPAL
MDAIDSVFDPLREFSKDSVRLVKRCHKPDRKEFTKVAFRTAIGFVVMGFVELHIGIISKAKPSIFDAVIDGGGRMPQDIYGDRMDGSRLDRKMQR